jgi:probable dihydroxyacetone kinase regulator
MSSITKRALAASFKNLLASRALDKITVKDIVEDAQVNRQTFYYHFSDIYDLVRWILDGETQAAFASTDNIENWRAYLTRVLKSLIAERSLVLNALHPFSGEYVEQYLYDVMYRLVYSTLDHLCRAFGFRRRQGVYSRFL